MPMRVIAKKRCRAMFEPPEKGERATLNPNLSTRLNLLFFRSGPWAAGWLFLVEEGERAALNFQRKDFEIMQQDQVRDPSPTNRAVSIRCRMFSVMSELGQKAKYSLRAYVFRSAPNNGHKATTAALPKCANSGSRPCEVTAPFSGSGPYHGRPTVGIYPMER